MILNPKIHEINITKTLALDLETTGLQPWKGAKIDLIAIKNLEGTKYVLEADRYSQGELGALFDIIAPNLVIGHNIKFDVNFILYHYGVLFENVFCTQVASQILDNGRQKELRFNLLAVLERYLGTNYAFEKAEKKELQKQFINPIIRKNLISLPAIREKQIAYAAEDVEHLIPLYEKLNDLLESRHLNKIGRLEFKVLPILSKMECKGVSIDKEGWLKLIEEWEIEREALIVKLDTEVQNILNGRKTGFDFRRGKTSSSQYNIFGSFDTIHSNGENAFNYSSSDQVLQLWGALGEALPRDSEGKAACGEDIISTYLTENTGTKLGRFIELLLEYREIDKLLSTYGYSFLDQLDENNCIHTSYTQTRTETGRLSSKEPNLQNIPSDSAPSRNIRRFFRARPGKKLITCDMAGAEISIAADFSGEPLLINALVNGTDMHSELASVSFSIIFKQPVVVNKSKDTITVDGYTYKLKDLRDEHKSVVFAKFYKAGAKRVYTVLSQYINRHHSPEQRLAIAGQISEALDARMPVLSTYLSSLITKAKTTGILISDKLGRIRHFPPTVYGEAANYPIQGTNANALKIALINITKYLGGNALGQILMNIHDEVVVEVDEDKAEEVAPEIRRIMGEALSYFFTTLKGDASASISDEWKK